MRPGRSWPRSSRTRERARRGAARPRTRPGRARTPQREPEPARRLRDRARRPRAGRGLARAPRRAARRAHRARRLHASPSQGATAYVTLEPCSHHGRQPPCADALIAAGIARVVCAIGDPNPEVDGRGLERLRAAGSRGRARRRPPRGAGAPPERRLPHATSCAAARSCCSSWPRRWTAASPRARGRAAGSPRPRAAGSCTTGGPSSTRSPSAAARRWPTIPSCCRATRDPPAERLPLRVVFDRRGRLAAGSRLAQSAATRRPSRAWPRPVRRRRRPASRRWRRPRWRRRSAPWARARSPRCWSRAAPSSRPASCAQASSMRSRCSWRRA